MRISDWSSDVCSSDLVAEARQRFDAPLQERSQALERLQQETAALSAQLQRTETALPDEQRSEARRVGKDGVSTNRNRWLTYDSKKKNTDYTEICKEE